MKTKISRWIWIMIITFVITCIMYGWFMINPGEHWPYFFGELALAFCICIYAGLKELHSFDIKDKV